MTYLPLFTSGLASISGVLEFKLTFHGFHHPWLHPVSSSLGPPCILLYGLKCGPAPHTKVTGRKPDHGRNQNSPQKSNSSHMVPYGMYEIDRSNTFYQAFIWIPSGYSACTRIPTISGMGLLLAKRLLQPSLKSASLGCPKGWWSTFLRVLFFPSKRKSTGITCYNMV